MPKPAPDLTPTLRRRPDAQPGTSAIKQIIQTFEPIIYYYMIFAAAWGILVGVVFIPWLLDVGVSRPVIRLGGIAMFMLALGTLWLRQRRAITGIDRHAAGRKGEMAMADQLQSLRALGYEILHDLPHDPRREDSPNIDHVVIGPAGLFVLETKYRTKRDGEEIVVEGERLRIGDQPIAERAIGQTIGNARRVAEILREVTGRRDITTQPVLIFVGRWFINDPRPMNERPFWVCNDLAFVKLIQKQPRTLSNENIALYATRLREYAAPRER